MKIHFTLRDNTQRIIEAAVGQNLMIVARDNGLDIEGACDGAMACSTCHMIIGPNWVAKLPPPTQDETDLLSLASGLRRTSRLGCQIVLTESMDGLAVRLAGG